MYVVTVVNVSCKWVIFLQFSLLLLLYPVYIYSNSCKCRNVFTVLFSLIQLLYTPTICIIRL